MHVVILNKGAAATCKFGSATKALRNKDPLPRVYTPAGKLQNTAEEDSVGTSSIVNPQVFAVIAWV